MVGSAKEIVKKKVNLENVRWVSGAAPALPLDIRTKIRYRGKEIAAVLRHGSARYELEFSKLQIAPAAGQSGSGRLRLEGALGG